MNIITTIDIRVELLKNNVSVKELINVSELSKSTINKILNGDLESCKLSSINEFYQNLIILGVNISFVDWSNYVLVNKHD